MKQLKQVQIGYDRVPEATVLHTTEYGIVDRTITVLRGIDSEVLRITLSNGKRMEIDLFERETGFLTIRSDQGQMIIRPTSGNSIQIGRE